jgi:deoxycytidylate deaminase
MKIRKCYDDVDNDISSRSKGESDYMEYARQLAMNSNMLQRHGCVLVHKNKVLSKSVNTKPRGCQYSVHAEINAIKPLKRFPNILRESELYVARIGTDSMHSPLRYSKPCPECTKFILQYKLRKVFYSINTCPIICNEE